MYHMEMDFYGIYALVFVSECYVPTHFPWSHFYIYEALLSKMNEKEWSFFDSAFARPYQASHVCLEKTINKQS